eukprot:TRINITY_DN11475_c0_g1_i3.p1 TRINITY_DN11475_c0_g1~~TRINITY_DN11475_c0_g1_i3.p1  ORF type:complete len:381 (+),score=33.72 TRINITY_DN11475_c0_g1_i3:184-1326(+)
MKFCKRLRDQVEETLPEWRNKFLSYKQLKKRLKSSSKGNCLSRLPVPATDTEVKLGPDAVTSGEQFVQLLNDELEKFNSFFMEKEEEFVIRSHAIKERIAHMRVVCPGGDLNAFGCPCDINNVRKAVVSLHGEMVLLENYSSLNYMGLVKILKKHDKRTGRLLRHPFILNVLRQPFFTTELISRLVKDCEDMLQQLLPPQPSTSCSQACDGSEYASASGADLRTDLAIAGAADGANLAAGDVTLSAPVDAGQEMHADLSPLLPEDADEEIGMVYRSACTALRSLLEIRVTSKTPHPLLAEVNAAMRSGHLSGNFSSGEDGDSGESEGEAEALPVARTAGSGDCCRGSCRGSSAVSDGSRGNREAAAVQVEGVCVRNVCAL